MRVVQNSNNIVRVIKLIYLNPGISRIEISKQLGLDRSTITVVVNRLVDLQLIEEIVDENPVYKKGRTPIGLKICDQSGILLGLEIRTDFFVASFVSLNGQILDTIKGDVEESPSFIDTFKNIYRKVVKEIEKKNLPLLGIGVAISGIINTHKGIISGSNPLGIMEELNFYNEVKAFIDVPVFIENDANCGCWGELANISNNREQDFLFVLGEFRKARFLGDNTHLLAIGIGLVIDKRVHYGKEFSAGEYQNPQYVIGNKTQFSITNEEFSLIKSDRDIIERVKTELSRDMAFLVNILNLTQISIGGDLVQYFEDIEPCLKAEIQRNSSYKGYNNFIIQKATEGAYSIAFGAASMLREHLFLTYENEFDNPWQQKVGINLLNSFSQTIRNFNFKK